MVEERYEIRGKIGQGGVGAVYKAYDTQLRREVAIKRVLADELDENNENATNNLLQEATALSSVQHPHICTVYDAGVDDDGPFVVMELINGKTLDEMVERGTLTYEDFREVAIQSQEAMIAAQELNLVHRDLKPSNVMVSWLPSGRFQIKLVDFGLAKFSAQPSLQTIDHGDSVFGSIFFMAPEQFERTALDQRTDMYSLGSMFYYSLTGKYPFDGDTAPQVMASHLQNTVIPLQQVRPDLPIWLCEWVMWHIQKEMDHRPPSAKIALDKFLADEVTASQGGMGQTQQLNTPTVPLLRKNTTGVVATQPAGNISGPVSPLATASPVSTNTAPQPILSPNGTPNTSTSPVAIQPAGALRATPATSSTTAQAPPAGTPDPESPVLYSPPKKQNKTMMMVIASMLIVGLVIMGFVLFGANEKKDHLDTYSRLIKDVVAKFEAGETLPVTKTELDNLLTSMTMPTIKDKVGGYYALTIAESKNGDFSPTLETAKFINTPGQNLQDESIRELFRGIARNPNHDPEAHKIILKYALSHPNKQHSADAILKMKDFADDSYLDDLLAIYDKTDEIATRSSCSSTIAEIVKRSKTKSSIAADIIHRYKNATDGDQKLAYLRLLGTTGSKEAEDILYQALKGDDLKSKISASKGLSTSPNVKPFEAMLAVYAKEKSESNNRKFRDNIITLLEANTTVPDNKKIEMWTKFIEQSPTTRSQQKVIGKVTGEKSTWATKLLKNILADPKYSSKIKDHVKARLEEWAKQKV